MLSVKDDAGLAWSPSRSRLSFYGPSSVRQRLQDLIGDAAKDNLKAATSGPVQLERIDTYQSLLNWLIRYMSTNEKREFAAPLVRLAKSIVPEFIGFGKKRSDVPDVVPSAMSRQKLYPTAPVFHTLV